ncbi:MAG: thermopsin family protease [Actinomycetota bacterium]|nr:thermopsin family protease [Actinomycetota bacterium]
MRQLRLVLGRCALVCTCATVLCLGASSAGAAVVTLSPGVVTPDGPTGIASYGTPLSPPDPSAGANPVTTSEIVGYASFTALTVSENLAYPTRVPTPASTMSLQMDTILASSGGGATYYYLIQNVPELDTASDTMSVISNVYAFGTASEPAGMPCDTQRRATVNFEMQYVHGELGNVEPETGTAVQCSPEFYASAASIGTYSLPLQVMVGTKIVGNAAELFIETGTTAPHVYDTITFGIPGTTPSLVTSTTAGGFAGVGTAAWYLGGPGGGETAVFSAINGYMGLYYLDGNRMVAFASIENANSPNTSVPEGTANVRLSIASNGFVHLTLGTPVGLVDTAFSPPVPAVVGMVAGPGGGGYWDVASDGGIFSFGSARFYGSMGGKPLNEPIVGIAAVPGGGGYWDVASDGGIFSFGSAQFYGSMGGKPLNEPIVGMTAVPGGGGYWDVASDGGIFSFGDAAFSGSVTLMED